MLTVLMATHNGAGTLPKVLDSYLLLNPPPGGWKLVVVDNASSDETSLVLEQYSRRLPLLALRTEQRGKNVALNEGLKHLQGDLVVLTDDDAIPDLNWLISLSAAAKEHTQFDVFGGTIRPLWPYEPPDWILRLVNLGATFALTPSNIPLGPVSAGQVWGPNMAVRRSVFEAGHRFNEAVGPQSGQYIMGSETEFTCRIEKLGHKALFVPHAIVEHIIRPSQMERKWIVERACRMGKGTYYQEAPFFKDGSRFLWGVPRWKLRFLLSAWLDSFVGALRKDFDRKFRGDLERSFYKGYFTEARKNSRVIRQAKTGVAEFE